MEDYDYPEIIGGLMELLSLYQKKFLEPEKGTVGYRGGWIFRGHRKHCWPLETSLERCLRRNELDLEKASELEEQVIKDFRRRYPHYAPNPPDEADIMAWLAVMQHYGSPTRLLDWTYSFFLATFFALEAAASETDAAIWAIHSTWLYEYVPGYLESLQAGMRQEVEKYQKNRRKEQYEKLFHQHLPFVLPVNPFPLNERLTIQQGVFLCVGNTKQPFVENLKALAPPHDKLYRIRIRSSARRDILLALHRMNVNAAALFPGLDGFARSLQTKILILDYQRSQTER